MRCQECGKNLTNEDDCYGHDCEEPVCKCGSKFDWVTERCPSSNGDGYGKTTGYGICKNCGEYFDEN